MTNVHEIRHWISEASNDDQFMLVKTDTFDWGDYPVYARDAAHCWDSIDQGGKIMEVYDLNMSIEDQLKEHRADHRPARPEETDCGCS